VGSALIGKVLSFLLQRVGWEVGLILAMVFSMGNPEDQTTVGNFMLPYNEGTSSPKPPLPASSPVPSISSGGSSQFEEGFGIQTGGGSSAIPDQERPQPQEEGNGVYSEAPSSEAEGRFNQAPPDPYTGIAVYKAPSPGARVEVFEIPETPRSLPTTSSPAAEGGKFRIPSPEMSQSELLGGDSSAAPDQEKLRPQEAGGSLPTTSSPAVEPPVSDGPTFQDVQSKVEELVFSYGNKGIKRELVEKLQGPDELNLLHASPEKRRKIQRVVEKLLSRRENSAQNAAAKLTLLIQQWEAGRGKRSCHDRKEK